jgi:transcription initiation factor TFIIB
MTNTDNRSERSTKRNLEKALTTIDDLSKRKNISSEARATATTLYQKLLKEHSVLYGWDIETAACACLYLACKMEQEGISPSTLADEHKNVREKIVLRRAKQLRTELGLEFVDIVDPIQYVKQYTEELEASKDVKTRAEEIATEILDTPLISGRNPRGVAAAAIYNAVLENNEEITQEELANVADVTEVTIRNRYQEQREYLE